MKYTARTIFLGVILTFGLGMVLPAYASTTVGTIDATNKSAKICKDTSCTSFGVVNFKPTLSESTPGATAVTITDTAITGNVWGAETGWMNLAPTGAGLTVNPVSGVITGKGFASTGSWINFNPTGQGVVINSAGQFVGWAWVSGPNGGWMKFDCGAGATCVSTDWRPKPFREVCQNGIDDDGDGAIDTTDIGCTSPTGSSEFNIVATPTPAASPSLSTLPTPTVSTPTNGAPIQGTGFAGATVVVTTSPGAATCTATVQVNGTWNCVLSPAPTNGASVTLVETASGYNPATLTVNNAIDITVPATPTPTSPAAGGSVTNPTVVNGSCEPGSTVRISNSLITPNPTFTSCDSNGNYTLPVTWLQAANGTTQTLAINIIDRAGNTGATRNVQVQVDLVVPTTPVVTFPTPGGTTNGPVTGTGTPGTTITITANPGGSSCTTTVQPDGTWTCSLLPAPAPGPITITVVSTDAAGNTTTTGPTSVTVDTTEPSIPTVITPTNGNPLRGTGTPGDTIIVNLSPSGATCTTIVLPNGTWSCNLTPAPKNGDAITLVARDPAGNTRTVAPSAIGTGIDTTIITPTAGLIDETGDGNADYFKIDKSAFKGSYTIDLNGDGRADIFAIDTDGDGYPDAFPLDADGDGKNDIIPIDTNNDGLYDAYQRVGEGESTQGFSETEAGSGDCIICITARIGEDEVPVIKWGFVPRQLELAIRFNPVRNSGTPFSGANEPVNIDLTSVFLSLAVVGGATRLTWMMLLRKIFATMGK
jgi:hypothetical protein